MLGAIAGDIIGSIYERNRIKSEDFPLFRHDSRFTDDSVLTVAIASSILKKVSYLQSIKEFARRYPDAGYGGTFYQWMLSDDDQPYNSWGNGSAMRVSAIGFAYDTVDQVMEEARKSAEVTHNHPEGVKGAKAVAMTIFFSRLGAPKQHIKEVISKTFKYDLDRTIAEIRPNYSFDVSCQGSVPESIIAFLESTSYEDAVRKAISLGGDSDTMAAIAGSIAEAYYKVIPLHIIVEVRKRLPDEFLAIIDDFNTTYNLHWAK
jgi:ADP-ribosylglycohydrolase